MAELRHGTQLLGRTSGAVIDADVFAPRTDAERFRVYIVEGNDDLTLLATAADPAAVGVAIFALDDDEIAAGRRGLVDRGTVGVLDALERRWVVLPWQRRPI